MSRDQIVKILTNKSAVYGQMYFDADNNVLYEGARDGRLTIYPYQLGTVSSSTTVTPPNTNTGTVTSVALAVPSIFGITGSPITTSGTISITLSNENPNTVLAGPTSGSATTPTFRSLVSADIPSLVTSYWGLNGNSTTSSDFIGTTNNEPLIFKSSGNQMGYLNFAVRTISFGVGAGGTNVTGVRNVFIGENTGTDYTSGAFNVFIGDDTGGNLVTGNSHIGIGELALENINGGTGNIGIGYLSGSHIVGGSSNIFLGYQADSTGDYTNCVAIGTNSIVGGSNLFSIGGSTPLYIGVNLSTPTSQLHISAGTSTAGTSPLKLTPGVLLSTLEEGAIEYTDDGTTGHLYMTLNVSGTLTRVTII